jgi:hypothetical protein
MSVELDVSEACGASFDIVGPFEEKEESKSLHFHGRIFVPPYYPQAFVNQPALDVRTQELEKVNTTVVKNLGLKKDEGYHDEPNYSAGVGVSVNWGGGETTVEVGAYGRVEDSNGNYAEVNVSQSSDGTGSANVSAGREE